MAVATAGRTVCAAGSPAGGATRPSTATLPTMLQRRRSDRHLQSVAGDMPLVVGPPICGCDGKVHTGMCEAYHDGVDLDAHGTCDLLAGRLACGYTQCDLASQYCQREPQPGGPDAFTCMPLGSCSATPTCTCLKSQPCGSSCMGDSKVGLTLTCPPKL
ncbi:MAG: hypothetical protein E6J90_53160 [Deltaproteobacteria bacterium]|nr:MAG: hypothetical protein E6J90_53160 [Deltaproteobacteria bacterium]